MKKIIFFVALVLLAGCNGMHISHEHVDRVPASRLYSFSKRSDAQLIVILDSRLEAVCRVRLLIDRKPAADFYTGEIAYFGVTFGAHFLETQPSSDCVSFEPSQTKVDMKSGDASFWAMTSSGIEPATQ